MANPNNTPSKLPSEDIIKQMLENESKKLALQEKRFILEEQNQKRQFDYACKSLEVQKEFLKDKPKEQRKTIVKVFMISILCLIVLLSFFGYCIYMGKEQIVVDVLKYLGVAVLSFFSGKYYGKSKTVSDKSKAYEVLDDVSEE